MATPPAPPLVRCLGWLSLASGVALVVAPCPLGRLYGLPVRRTLLRALGVRDAVVGVGLLAGGRRRAWLAARAASDALDAALIAADARRGVRGKVGGRVALALGVAALSSALAAKGNARPARATPGDHPSTDPGAHAREAWAPSKAKGPGPAATRA